MFATLSNAERRLYEAVGLQRRAKNVTPPSVADYLKHKQQLKEAAS
jgi:hypothetical protein